MTEETRTDNEGGIATFAEWQKAVDRILFKLVSMVAYDCADYASYDSWDNGLTPIEGAWACLEAQDYWSQDQLTELFGGCYG